MSVSSIFPACAKIARKNQVIFAFFGLWILTTAYIAVFPTRHFTLDAINTLSYIESHDIFELWHPQHLLGLFPGYWLYQLLGGTVRAWQAMGIAYALIGGATVAFVFASIYLLTHKSIISVGAALILWFSYGFWHFQSDPDVYSIGFLGVALLIFTYIDYLQTPTRGRIIRLGFAAAFAILTHQMNIEITGLIGLSLIWWAWRAPAARRMSFWRDVAVYAIIPLVIVPAIYFMGWLSVNDYLRRTSQPEYSFLGRALRYFAVARSGQAVWGTSLNLRSLPVTAYGILTSWTLPPLIHDMTFFQGLFLGLILCGAAIFLLHSPFVLRRLPMPYRLIALVCGLTVIANSFSAWWWQAGNIKFSLLMEIPIVIMGVLYLSVPVGLWERRLRYFALGMAATGLIAAHIFYTLPYETKGGVFTVAEIDGITSKAVWFENDLYAEEYSRIATAQRRVLPAGFCQRPSSDSTDTVWVIDEQTVNSCPAMANATRLGEFQTDRSRDEWGIFELKQSN